MEAMENETAGAFQYIFAPHGIAADAAKLVLTVEKSFGRACFQHKLNRIEIGDADQLQRLPGRTCERGETTIAERCCLSLRMRIQLLPP